MKQNYTPVSCLLYDELERYAVKSTNVKIKYLEDNEEKSIEDFIINLETKNKEEFLILKSGGKIRLDKIISLNDKVFSEECSI